MKKIMTVMVALMLLSCATWAKGTKEGHDYSFTAYQNAVSNKIDTGHKMSKAEENIVTLCYAWYDNKASKDGGWDTEKWTYAIEKAYGLTKSKMAMLAANGSVLGEKAIKAILITADKAAKATKKWLDDGSAEYDAKNP